MPAKKKSKSKPQNKKEKKAQNNLGNSLENSKDNKQLGSPWSPTTAPDLEFRIVSQNEISQLHTTYCGSLFYVSSAQAEKSETANLMHANSPATIIHFTVKKISDSEYFISNLKYPGSCSNLEVSLVED